MRHIYILILSFVCVTLFAQEDKKRPLWPDDLSLTEAAIYVYHPNNSSSDKPAILICPGGGYSGLAMDHEGYQMAEWFASQGFTAVILQYRMPKGDHTVPLADAEKAIKTIRENAAEWGVNPKKVGVIGSSAGGHLAASLSTLAADANRPDYAILFYPVISFDDAITHPGSKENLLGNKLHDSSYVERYSLEKQVNGKTPPTLLFHSDDDGLVPPANSLRYYSALKETNIPASMYIFPVGEHGWGFRSSFEYHDEMKNLLLKWIQKTIHIE